MVRLVDNRGFVRAFTQIRTHTATRHLEPAFITGTWKHGGDHARAVSLKYDAFAHTCTRELRQTIQHAHFSFSLTKFINNAKCKRFDRERWRIYANEKKEWCEMGKVALGKMTPEML